VIECGFVRSSCESCFLYDVIAGRIRGHNWNAVTPYSIQEIRGGVRNVLDIPVNVRFASSVVDIVTP
jgi:hypothetical protein